MRAIAAVHRCVLLLALAVWLGSSPPAFGQTDPLPSWNEGPAKKAIVEFVQATTDKASPKFVPPEARIATFDQDGTLVGLASDVHAGGLLPGAGASGGGEEARAEERGAVQDRAVRQPGGDGEALDEGPRGRSSPPPSPA